MNLELGMRRFTLEWFRENPLVFIYGIILIIGFSIYFMSQIISFIESGHKKHVNELIKKRINGVVEYIEPATRGQVKALIFDSVSNVTTTLWFRVSGRPEYTGSIIVGDSIKKESGTDRIEIIRNIDSIYRPVFAYTYSDSYWNIYRRF